MLMCKVTYPQPHARTPDRSLLRTCDVCALNPVSHCSSACTTCYRPLSQQVLHLGVCVCWRHHTRVKQHQPIASDEVQSTPTSLAAEQEYKLVVLWVIELLDQLLALADASAAIQAQEGILQCRQNLSATTVCLQHHLPHTAALAPAAI